MKGFFHPALRVRHLVFNRFELVVLGFFSFHNLGCLFSARAIGENA